MPEFSPYPNESPEEFAARQARQGHGGGFDLLSALGNLRYGVPTAEKERLARTGELPGAPSYDPSLPDEENMARADRHAAGYLFGKAHPTLAPMVQPFVNRIKTSDLPLLGGSSPKEQSFAQQGVNIGAGEGQASQSDLISRLMALFGG